MQVISSTMSKQKTLPLPLSLTHNFCFTLPPAENGFLILRFKIGGKVFYKYTLDTKKKTTTTRDYTKKKTHSDVACMDHLNFSFLCPS